MSGFKKRTATKGPTIRGTVISPKTLQLLTSSGASSLDSLINGGLPVGTIALFEDYTNSTNKNSGISKTFYSKVLINQFLEEGSAYDHDIFVASCGEKFSTIISDSNEKEETQISSDNKVEADSTLKIAWRYQNQSASSENQKKTSSLKITGESDSTSNVTYKENESRFFKWHITDIGASIFNNDVYITLFKKISEACMDIKLNLPTSCTSSSPSLIRIAITDIGSLPCCDQNTHRFKLMQFLYALKSLARNRLCVIALTQTSNIESSLDQPNLQNSIRDMVDFVFQFNPLKTEPNEAHSKKTKSHHGILHIIKTPSLRCLKSPSLRNHGQYLFKSTKNKFVLERMHLPPELGYAADTPKQSIDF